MPVPEGWWRLDATGQAKLVREGVATPSELVEAVIERIEALNPAINAVVTPLYEAGRRIASELPDAGQPFRGVPILLKDAGEELEGTPYYLGTSVLRTIDYRSTRTTEFVRRLLAAGFVPIGKTNIPELSSGLTTEPRAFGPTRNPWDLERSAGGSSGGSAAAVAAGMVAVASGSDATGSLRVPAALCGVVSLRPTPGRAPTAVPAEQPSDVWSGFVLARSARDLAGVLAVTADDMRPATEPRAVRAAVVDADWDGRAEVNAESAEAARTVGRVLAELGHQAQSEAPTALTGFMERILPAIMTSLGPAREVQLRWLEQTIGRELRPRDLEHDYERIPELSSDMALTTRSGPIAAESAGLLGWWDEHDVLVTPATRQPAWRLGLEDGPQHAGPFVFPFSFTGQPVLSLPVAVTVGGLPVGVQLVGRPGGDEQLLALGAQLEAALPPRALWPPLADGPAEVS